MAVVEYASGINTVKGALTKAKKKEGHKCGNYLIGTHREAATTNPNCSRLYVKPASAYDRHTPVTADEQAQRTRFATVSRMVQARKQDLTKIAGDLAAFNAQKDNPNGKKTMRSYLWMVCDAELG